MRTVAQLQHESGSLVQHVNLAMGWIVNDNVCAGFADFDLAQPLWIGQCFGPLEGAAEPALATIPRAGRNILNQERLRIGPPSPVAEDDCNAILPKPLKSPQDDA